MAQDILKHLKRPCLQYPRHFCPHDLNYSDWTQLEELYQDLTNRTIPDQKTADQWIMDWSELESILSEQYARLYINMTCYTEDSENDSLYSDFVEKIEPNQKPWNQKLRAKLLALPFIKELESGFYSGWIKEIRNASELYSESNIEPETQTALEIQKYQKVTGTMTVEFNGKSHTLPEMSVYLQDPDRQVRETAWRKIAERRLQDHQALDHHFENLLTLRMQKMKNSGYSEYLPYVFRLMSRWDYTPEDCRTFHRTVESEVVPMYNKLLKIRATKMGLESLRPWDLECDPLGRPGLKPYQSSEELIDGVKRIFSKVDPVCHQQFSLMHQKGLLDLDNRPGKAPGGYQFGLEEYRLPFIFMNGAGTNSDVFTLLHEAGHSFHQFEMACQDLIAYRNIPSEFAEVASMSMELIGSTFLEEFYSPSEKKRALADNLFGILKFLPWMATIDAFQHWIYSNPGHSSVERNETFLNLSRRFGGDINWDGLESERAWYWQRQLHLFEVPFYYVEYGIAQLGALQVWNNYKENPEATMQNFRKALALGNSKPLPDLFATAGIRFDFSAETLKPLVDKVYRELSKIGDKEI
jgi:oligoendopeptidase F